MPNKKKGTYQGKAESPTLGQQKLPCNCVTNPLALTIRCVTNPLVPTTCCFFWPNKYPRELGLRAFSSSHPWWGREALAQGSNKFPYCKLHCFEESSFPTGDSDYGQNKLRLVCVWQSMYNTTSDFLVVFSSIDTPRLLGNNMHYFVINYFPFISHLYYTMLTLGLGLQRVGHNWVTELNWTDAYSIILILEIYVWHIQNQQAFLVAQR